MTREDLFSIIEEHNGELIFEDGYAMTDWSGARFCLYSPDQGFGEGHICGFTDALQFYQLHSKEIKNMLIHTQHFGGRGSGGASKAGGGGGAAKSGGATQEQKAKQALNSLNSTSSVQDRVEAVNQALTAGVNDGVTDAVKGFPKGTVMSIYGFGGRSGSYTKTGNRGKDGWRNTRTFERVSTSSLMYDAKSITASKR